MRRSSCIALALAVALLAVSALFYLHTFTTNAGPMTPAALQAVIRKGADAVERKDVGAVMDLFAPGALILNRNTEQLRPLVESAMNEVRGTLRVTTRNIAVESTGTEAVGRFDMDLGQKTASMEAIYFPDLHVQVRLVRVRTSRWFGLFSTEEWKIAGLESKGSLEAPAL